MVHSDWSSAIASQRIVELRRQADQQRLDRRIPGRTPHRQEPRALGPPRLAGRHRQAAACAGGRAAVAAAASGPGQATTEAAMLIQRQHTPEEFDPGHCRTCARQAGLLDHYDRVRQEETRLQQARMWANAARRYAIWALGSSGAAILLAAVALLTR
jgi:hypothetical protein